MQWLGRSTNNRQGCVRVPFPADGYALVMIPNKGEAAVQCFRNLR